MDGDRDREEDDKEESGHGEKKDDEGDERQRSRPATLQCLIRRPSFLVPATIVQSRDQQKPTCYLTGLSVVPVAFLVSACIGFIRFIMVSSRRDGPTGFV